MEITYVRRLKVAEALDETTIGSSKAWAYRCSDTMKETKIVLEENLPDTEYICIFITE